jgi:glycosyltransferase involved in cell wall biosynthesis
MSGVLAFHNILWSQYKGRIFSELYNLCTERSIKFFVVQYATTERQRVSLGSIDQKLHQYPYRLMSGGPYDEVSFWTKVRIGLEEIRNKDPEVVVLPGYWDLSHWVLLAISRFQGRKVILSFDSTELDHPRHWIRELAKRLFVSQCDGGFTYGQRSRRYLHQLGMPEHKITVRCLAAANEEIRDIFDAAKVTRNQLIKELGLGLSNFCYVGRLSPEKNVSCLIHAFAMLRRESDEAGTWGLLVVGDGPEHQALVHLCRGEGLSDVRFAGGVSWREVPRLLAACDVLVLPSKSEPWGLVVNEAMVCGLPVLVSEACGCVDELVILGKTGFTFSPTSPHELRERMETFVRRSEEVVRCGAAAEELIKQFSPMAAASQMLHGIQRVLNSK